MTDGLPHPSGRQLFGWIARRLERYRVVGPSMEPTLRDGEFVLVSARAHIAPGTIVVADHPTQDTVIMKRVAAIEADTVRLVSDNLRGTDSRHFGSIERSAIIGTVVAKFPTS